MWLGAHPNAPSLIKTESGELPLDSFLASDPALHLGKAAAIYDAKLPFLLKVLAAHTPLSIQVHPDKKTAVEGFASENLAGIPHSDSHRNFKDDNHKPELIMALTPFLLMRGFRYYPEIIALFDALGITHLWPDFAIFAENPSPVTIKALFAQILASTKEQLKLFMDKVNLVRTAKYPELKLLSNIIRLLNMLYPLDCGIVCPLLLNTLELKPGEAVWLDAGIPHAYIHGAGVELMANSDNVIRAGLTPKHIDRELLLEVTDFTPSVPAVQGLEADSALTEYSSPFREFQLVHLTLNGSISFNHSERPAILLCLQGKLMLNGSMDLAKGKAVFISVTDPELQLTGKAELVIATTPN